ncbi:MAG: YqeG family HAD IIIA-type phosphatase [Oscillospiraceae bacterium]|nr:YqeG family HAD IIIA-type phosphatase [Oscillospiraceae bacterium]
MLKPTYWLKNVFAIDEAFLSNHGIKGLILDLDNTLSMHGSPAAESGIIEWLTDMRRLKIKMLVVSNNTNTRVKPLTEQLGLKYIAWGCKPLPFGINKAAKAMKLPKSGIAVVGDQIFTDVMGGNLSGIRTILVEPFYLESGVGFKLKRKIESVVFKRDFSTMQK